MNAFIKGGIRIATFAVLCPLYPLYILLLILLSPIALLIRTIVKYVKLHYVSPEHKPGI